MINKKVPLVSVIIPTYNRYPMLAPAIESVKEQTFKDYELIIVDDCSDDETGSKLKNDNSLMYLRLYERSFPSGARNRGVEKAQGKYVAFLDSDDLWHKEKLEKQVAFFREHPLIRIGHTDEQWIRNGKKVNQKKKHEKSGGYIFERCLHRCLISPSAVMMEHSLFKEYRGFDESIEVGEDYHLWLKITAREEIGFINEKLTVKRGGHEDQLSHKYGQIEIFRIKALEKILKDRVLSMDQEKQAKEVLGEKCRIYAEGCMNRGKKEEAEEYFRIAEQL